MAQDYVPPAYGVDGFNCPNCGAFAHQHWYYGIWAHTTHGGSGSSLKLAFLTISACERCNRFALWDNKKRTLIYPQMYVAPLPATDMPEDVKGDYEEARSIFSQSSRGAAALLRLAIQKLVIALGESGDDLNKSIGNLVKKGLRTDIQKALDVVRVVGNNAVHPGQIVIEDNPEVALSLF